MEIKISRDELGKRKLFLSTPMYAGACSGMYTKSMTDLSAMCVKYGIELKIYYLFNESLITRARNYCCDEFMRSGSTHLMFIDSDIGFNPNDVIAMLAMQTDDSPYDIIAGPYPKKSVPFNGLIETEDGLQKIGQLVKDKYTGKVLTINEETGILEWNKVIEHHVSLGHPSKRWVSIGRQGRKNLVVTDDHECATVDDVLYPNKIQYVEAKNLKGKYILKKPVSNRKNNVNPLYNKEQMSFLIGTLLGDGSITKTGYLKFGHSVKQQKYLHLKESLFCGKLSSVKNIGSYWTKERIIQEGDTLVKIQPEYKEYFGQFLECPRNEQILKLRELMYPEGKKIIKNVLSLLDEKGLAFWYLDDGNLYYQINSPRVRFCTDSFSYDEHLLLQTHFDEKWGIDINISKHKNTHRLNLSVKEHNKFFNLIKKFVPTHMEYKLPEQYRGGEKHKYNNTLLEYAAEYVKDVRTVDNYSPNSSQQPRKQYDIGVENNHNFICNGYVVPIVYHGKRSKWPSIRGPPMRIQMN